MALDTRRSRAGKFSRNKYYKGEYVEKMQLVKDAISQGVFYSSDKEAFTVSTIVSGAMKKQMITGVIVTNDYIPDLEPDDFVEYEGILHLVEKVVFDDLNDNKEFSTRPSYETTITLRR